jgi:hypothetical protein
MLDCFPQVMRLTMPGSSPAPPDLSANSQTRRLRKIARFGLIIDLEEIIDLPRLEFWSIG